MMPPTIEKTSTHRGTRSKTKNTSQSYDNPSYIVDEPPTVDKIPTADKIPTIGERPLTVADIEKNQNEAWKEIIDKFPDFNSKTAKFTARVDEFGTVKVKLMRKGSREYNFFDANGELIGDLQISDYR